MNDVAIRTSGLSKQYTIGGRRTPRDRFRAGFTTMPEQNANTIWALNDVSFEVKQGEVLGIIGKNGSGKSTLLKILSRITKPTRGEAEIHGRVGSLLEVGTGFHPELTGRENIQLNGALLGMKKAEIDRHFDAIVAFAEVEKFLDMPVKRYSSGMYMRLAFAVAAHLVTDILFVDEVLAVGDAAFQKKCLGKMDEVSRDGRTILFVTHNLGAVAQLCPRTLLLKSGRVVSLDKSETILANYLSEGSSDMLDVLLDPMRNPASPLVLTRCHIAALDETPVRRVDVARGFKILLEAIARREVIDTDVSIRVSSDLGAPLFTTNLSDSMGKLARIGPGKCFYEVEIPSHFLAPGTYSLHVGIHRPNVEALDVHDGILSFSVEESGSDMWNYRGKRYGSILVNFPWSEEYAS